MAPSSGTSVIARADMINVARSMIMSNIAHHEKHGEWPTLTQMAHRDSWRGAAMRREAREFLLDNDYVTVDGDRRGEVTIRAREWVDAPSFTPERAPAWIELPNEEDLLDTMIFVENFVDRRGHWPTSVDMKGAGVRRRIGADAFMQALEALIERGQFAKVGLRSGDRVLTYTVSLRFVPWLRGKHGLTYWWPSSNGPLPEG